jgi:hypothetical protein
VIEGDGNISCLINPAAGDRVAERGFILQKVQ